MTWRTPIVALLFGACASTAAIAGSLDLNLNNDVVEASYLSDPTTFQYRFGALHDDRTKDWLGHAGFVALGEQENQAMRSTIGFGGRVYSGSTGPFNILSVPLGGQFSVYPAGFGSIGFSGYAFYAPNVLSGLDTERFFDVGVRVEFEIIKPTTVIYLGYRKIEAKFKNLGTSTIEEGGHIGLRISF